MLPLRKFKSSLKVKLIDKSEKHFYDILEKELADCKTVLDVGCGVNSPLGKIRKPDLLEGIDLYLPKKNNQAHDVYKKGNILALEKYYKKKSFDAVVLLGVIEHLRRSEAFLFMKTLEKIAKKKIIIQTPNGFIPQPAVDGNPYQEHISGWSVSDFESLGYKCNGLRGLRSLRWMYALVKYKPWYLWLFISYLTQFVMYFIPRGAFELMAVKNIKKIR